MNVELQGFCSLKVEITQFPDGFHLNIFAQAEKDIPGVTQQIVGEILKSGNLPS